MRKKKRLIDFEREAQNKADTYQKKTYLFMRSGSYQITFKAPANLKLQSFLCIGACVEFTPKECV